MNTNTLKKDVLSSLVVFIIAIPLTLGIAIASGVPMQSALITAIIGGIVVGLLSGAPLVVTGPAAGLTALVYQNVQDFGLSGLFGITILCGLIQVLAAAMKGGKIFEKFPEIVLKGMLTAIGIIIITSQIHIVLGHSASGSFGKLLSQIPGNVMNLKPITVLFGVAALFCLFYFQNKLPPKLKVIPIALPVVVLGTLISLGFELRRIELQPLGEAVKNHFDTFSYSQLFTLETLKTLFFASLGMAVVASAESLLTARAIDQMKPGASSSNLNKELFAQGVGNTITGVLGGIPMTGVIVRSAANVNSGAETRASTILHSIWILLFVVALPFVLAQIPLVLLSAVLIATGIKLLNVKEWLGYFKKESKIDFYLGAFTILSILATSLLTGLVVSLIVTIISKMMFEKKLNNTVNKKAA